MRGRRPAGVAPFTSILACALLLVSCGLPSASQQPHEREPVASPAPGTSVAANSSPAVHVYQAHGHAVVSVTGLATVRTSSGEARLARAAGSGFVWDGAGYAVTNHHMVEFADQLAVTFQDRTSVPAVLLGRDEPNDLAVLRLQPDLTDTNGRPVRGRLRPVIIGDSDRIVIGETAIAIGSPLGLQRTVTAGIVSALRPAGEDTGPGPLELLGGAIQTDAAINAGNSGGPLFNAAGEVIGVTTAIASWSGGNIGIGFAIPIKVVKRVTPELIQFGCYKHPLLGVTTIPLALFSPQARAQLGIPPNQKGLLVQNVTAGAAAAGIQAGEQVVTLNGEPVRSGGDIILAIDGLRVQTGGELRAHLGNHKRPGDTVVLDILREDRDLQVSVTLHERPAQQECRS